MPDFIATASSDPSNLQQNPISNYDGRVKSGSKMKQIEGEEQQNASLMLDNNPRDKAADSLSVAVIPAARKAVDSGAAMLLANATKLERRLLTFQSYITLPVHG